MRFRKKPVEVSAVQWSGSNWHEVYWLAQHDVYLDGDKLAVKTLEGTLHADEGDWIIQGIKGEHYPCKPDIFEATYDRVGDSFGTETIAPDYAESAE